MDDRIECFKAYVIERASNPDFIHHQWYVDHHLNIVEQISIELLGKYPAANANIVKVLVWLHDLGKIMVKTKANNDDGDAVTLGHGREVLINMGFETSFIDRVIDYADQIDNHQGIDLNDAPIEVRIVSSADGAAHFIGPFFTLYWYENPNQGIDELITAGIEKAKWDFENKITLPEVKRFVALRYEQIREHNPKNRTKSFLI